MKTKTTTKLYAEYWSVVFENWIQISGSTTRVKAKARIEAYRKKYNCSADRKFRIVTVTTTEKIEEIK